MPTDLSILSAEQYHDGSSSPPSRQQSADKDKPKFKPKPKAKRQDSSGSGTKRKRDAAPSPGPASGDEEKKRSRGRPRLEMTDETAADRRRTQIRLAQRAYRDRKESAITTLEKKVKDLESSNSQMSRAFMELYQAAISNGLTISAPDFARKMSATKEAFASLSRPSNDDETLDEEEVPRFDAPANTNGGRPQNDSLEILRATMVDVPGLGSASNNAPATGPTPSRFGGYIISQEPFDPSEIPDASGMTGFTDQQTQGPLAFGSTGPQSTFSSSSYPINPFSTAASQSPLDLLASASTINFMPTNLNAPPQLYPQPSLPTTYSYLEHSFARHLQRRSLEHCYSLITTSSTPPQTLARVFGFCMLFETTDMIRARLARGISRTREEFFNNWSYPFVHLGGAGTYASVDSGGGGVIGRESAADPRRPRFGTGFSQGPFNERVTRARDEKLLGPTLKIAIPGFEDTFFDSEDIQEYLAERGVMLPPGVERAVVEVDMDAFKNGNGERKVGVGSEDSEKLAAAVGARDPQLALTAVIAPRLRTTGPQATQSLPQQQWSGSVAESAMGMAGLISTYHSSSTTPTFGHSGNVTPFSGAADGSAGMEGAGGVGSRRELVTVDVNTFIQELVTRMSCLGRSPGFRRGDVNDAFLMATHRASAF